MCENHEKASPETPGTSLGHELRNDALLDSFEQAWQSGERPDWRKFLVQVPEDRQAGFVSELIRIDIECLRQLGQAPSLDDYSDLPPDLRDRIAQLFDGPEEQQPSAPRHRRPESNGSDRNLLFGILALQMDFINRDALVEALRDWTTHKNKPLGQILVERGDLAAVRRDLLEPLVDEHVRQHAGDPAISLASVSTVPGELLDWDGQIDTDLEKSFRHYRVAKGSASDSAVRSSEGASRFRLIRLHAEGGLGAVYVARDTELNREVAVKKIKTQFTHDATNRGRFVLEAEITGGLEHPGIVPIYGLGRHEDGHPYYAMRFIRGDSLREAIIAFHSPHLVAAESHTEPNNGFAERYVVRTAEPSKTVESTFARRATTSDFESVEFRKLLGRFIDVCEAVEYAHSRGVLHRDLKPGNIMLGKYGETLVVDWGLAKAAGKSERFINNDELTLNPKSGSTVDHTADGSVIGTPAYMSPEQAAGRLGELGPATDVYSLGATLYHLLTGRAPLQGSNIAETLQRIQAAHFPAPRAVNPHIPKSLESICRKAMSVQQADRYDSCQAFAEDVERWLAGDAISAWREPLSARTKRWARRHPSIVAGLVASLVVGVFGLSGGLYLLNDEKNRTETARRAAEISSQTASEQARLALESLESVIGKIQGELEHVPRAGRVRERMLTSALDQLTRIDRAFTDGARIDRNSMVGHISLGDLYLRIASGSVRDSERKQAAMPSGTGSPTNLALSHYQRAYEIATELLEGQPGNFQARRDISIAHEKLGEIALLSRELNDALNHFQNALRIRELLATDNNAFLESDYDIYVALDRCGFVLKELGKLDDALPYVQRAKKIAWKSTETHPTSQLWKNAASVSLERLADLAQQSNKNSIAIEYLKEKLAFDESIAGGKTANGETNRNLAIACNKLGDALMRSAQYAEARKFYERGISLRLAMVEADPNDLRCQRDLAVGYVALGNVLLLLEESDLALKNYQQFSRLTENLLAVDSGNRNAQRDHATSLLSLGHVFLQTNQTENARKHYVAARDRLRELSASNVHDVRAKRDLIACHENIGRTYWETREFDLSIKQFQEGLSIIAGAITNGASADSFQHEKELLKNRIDFSEMSKVALGPWEQVLTTDDTKLSMVLFLRATEMLRQRSVPEAEKAIKEFRVRVAGRSDDLYNAGCLYSQCASIVVRNGLEPTEAERTEQKRFHDLSLACLKEAVAAGYNDFKLLREDTDLKSLHGLPEFEALFRM